MKSLVNCTPREFLTQTAKIRKSVSNWLTVTDIMAIRERQPKEIIDLTTVDKEKVADTLAENKKKLNEQAMKNLDAMFESMLELHPEETLEVLALICFVDPKDIDNYKMSDFFGVIAETINDQSVMDFFTSLVRLGQMNTSKA